jgi:O-succinylbenzoate synthase
MTFERVFYSPYQLVPKSGFGSVGKKAPRNGALLKFHWKDGRSGYADCFPWVELGDRSLAEQLSLLKIGKLTPLTQRSMEIASIDAHARKEGKSLFEGLSIPLSHAFIADLSLLSPSLLTSLSAQGFSRVKIKLGLQRDSVSQKVCGDEGGTLAGYFKSFDLLKMKFRLDFNNEPTRDEFERFLGQLGEGRQHLDFIEDPFPYDHQAWRDIQQKWNVRLALDRFPADVQLREKNETQFSKKFYSGSFSVLILKPAIQSPDSMIEFGKQMNASIIVTSYLDHPLGQLGAAWTAARFGNSIVETCGLLSHTSYEATLFSEQLNSESPIFVTPKGTGFGFDVLLSQQDWRPI